MTRVTQIPPDDGLAAAILTRRLRKCIAAGNHTASKCERCGL